MASKTSTRVPTVINLIETHAHLDDERFDEDLGEVIEKAQHAGVNRIISIGTGVESSRRALAITEQYPSVYAAIGIHPCNVEDEKGNFVAELRELACHPKVVALGEIGIDYYHQAEGLSWKEVSLWKKQQAEAFQQQLDLAVELGLNVIIHVRDAPGKQQAWDEALRLLVPYTDRLRAVFHCFGGTVAQATEIISLGHLVSFTGIITFKNAPLVRETAAAIPLDRFMVETDCPYLAPDPYRGKRAEPAHTRLVAEKIAEVRGLSLEEVAAVTTTTAEQFFKFT